MDLTGTEPSTQSAVTWWQDVRPILLPSCSGCHSDGQVAERLPLDSFGGARPLSSLVASRVAARTMPPFHSSKSPDCTPRFGFLDDPSLSEETIATLVAWADANAPEGDEAAAVAAEPPADRTLTDWTVELVRPDSYTPSPGDSHICFPLLMPGETSTWIEASEVIPQDPAVVHHAQVRLDTTGAALDLANDEGWYSCYGAIDGTDLGGFLPGAAPMELPADTAIEAPPGSVVVVQVHYFNADGGAHPDSTRVRLRTIDQAPLHEPEFLRVGNDSGPTIFGGLSPGDTGDLKFRIPAGENNHIELFEYRVPDDRTRAVYVVANHMHSVGVSARLWIDHADPAPGEPATECLLDTDDWDPAWQQTFQYDVDSVAAPLVRGGDTLWVECTFDNSLTNEGVVELLANEGLTAPFDVVFGPSILDEMCVSLVGMIDVTHDTRWPGEEAAPADTGETDTYAHTGATDSTGDTTVTGDTDTDTDPGVDTDEPVDTGPIVVDDPCLGSRILISEVVDHAVLGALKYVELLNVGAVSAPLGGVRLLKWTNGSPVAEEVVLPDVLLDPGVPWVVTSLDGVAEYSFLTGAPPDASSSVVTGNGDDAYALVDDFGTLDMYGEAGIDGSGLAWDYTDSVAARRASVDCGQTLWLSDEWAIDPGAVTASPGVVNPVTDGLETISDIQHEFIPIGSEVQLSKVMVIGVTDDGAFIQERGAGPYVGVFLWLGADFELTWGILEPGDLLEVSGVVSEWEGQTEVDVPNSAFGEVTVTGWEEIAVPQIVTLEELDVDPAPWEGVYIVVEGVEVSLAPDIDGVWTVANAGGTVGVDDAVWHYNGDRSVGTGFESIAGPLSSNSGEWALCPTGPTDVVPD